MPTLLIRALLLLSLVGCAAANPYDEPAPDVGQLWVEQAEERAEQRGTPRRVVDAEIYQNHRTWQVTPWFRIEDAAIDYPVQILVAESGDACIVSGSDWAGTLFNTYYRCPRWRRARP